MTADYPDLHVPAKEVQPAKSTFPVTATRAELDDRLKADLTEALTLIRERLDPRYSWLLTRELTWMQAGWLGEVRVLREVVDGIRHQVSRIAPPVEEAA